METAKQALVNSMVWKVSVKQPLFACLRQNRLLLASHFNSNEDLHL